jgi:HAD superfamily hydrolase (TIGR01458 family)
VIRGALLDLSGVLYVGGVVVPGAIEAVERLSSARLPTRYITNTTRRTARAVMARLAGMGFPIAADEVYTAPQAARDYLVAQGLTPYLLVHPNLEDELAGLADGEPNAVLVGDAGAGFTYDRLNEAFRLLLEGAPLVAMGDNRYFQEEDGLSLDVGPFVAALEYAAGVRAVVVGKPAPSFFHMGVASLGCPRDQVVMVGDDVQSDVVGALDAGLQGVLVRTGKYRPGDEAAMAGRGMVVDNVAQAVDWVLSQA